MHLHTDPRSGLGVDTPEFRQRAAHVELSDDPDIATQQTVEAMCQYIHAAAGDPLVQAIARRAVQQFAGAVVRFGNLEAIAPEACFWWCKHYLRFKHHGDQFEAWSSDLGDPRTKLQLLIAPDVLVRMKRMEGDCAIYTMMLCAMLEALGVQWQIATLAVDRRQPGVFSHVCARAVLPDGAEWLDASHGAYPGWRVPDRDIQRVWIFDQSGNRTEGNSMGRFTGLHGYRARAYRGMGTMVQDETGAWYDDGTPAMPDVNPPSDFGPLCPPGMIQTSPTSCASASGSSSLPPFLDSSGSPYSGPVYTAPSQNSAQWATFAAQLAKSGLTLAEINSIQPGTVVSANGAILRQNPGYAVPVGSSLSLTGGSSSSILYIAAFGIAALLLASMFKGGR